MGWLGDLFAAPMKRKVYSIQKRQTGKFLAIHHRSKFFDEFVKPDGSTTVLIESAWHDTEEAAGKAIDAHAAIHNGETVWEYRK